MSKPTMHLMNTDSDNGRELLLVCPDCDRRIVLKRPLPDQEAEMIVIDRGDFYVSHYGGAARVYAEVVNGSA